MSLKPENGDSLGEKHAHAAPGYDHTRDGDFSSDPENMVATSQGNALHQDLQGRHMQMIAMQVYLRLQSSEADRHKH